MSPCFLYLFFFFLFSTSMETFHCLWCNDTLVYIKQVTGKTWQLSFILYLTLNLIKNKKRQFNFCFVCTNLIFSSCGNRQAVRAEVGVTHRLAFQNRALEYWKSLTLAYFFAFISAQRSDLIRVRRTAEWSFLCTRNAMQTKWILCTAIPFHQYAVACVHSFPSVAGP